MAQAKEQAERCPKCGESPAMHRPTTGCLYNGWTNYETWLVGLWIDNEEPTYREAHRMAKAAARQGKLQREEHEGCEGFQPGEGSSYCSTCHEVVRTTVSILADTLKEWIEHMEPDLGPSLFSDLLTAALGEVEWRELAEHFLEE